METLLTFPRLLPAVFVARPNRFLILARCRGRLVRAACRDPGRLAELLRPGVSLMLEPAAASGRKTAFTATLVRASRRWVSLIPALANDVVDRSLRKRALSGWRGARIERREVKVGRSRFDFALSFRAKRWLVEVKAVSLVEKGAALFPDAPTKRGARHVEELTHHVEQGGHAAIVFVVFRDGARAVRPHAENDPAFAEALRRAKAAGVLLYAYACRVTPRGVAIAGRLPVLI